jgi:hypothetical protein
VMVVVVVMMMFTFMGATVWPQAQS